MKPTNILIPLTDLEEGYIWFNGKFVEWQDAKLHCLTHGLHYAISVYEGMRAYNGKLFMPEKHIARLIASAKNFQMEVKFSIEEIVLNIENLLKKNNLTDAYIRPLIFTSSENLVLKTDLENANIFIAAWKSRMPVNSEYNIIAAGQRPKNDYIKASCKASSNYASMYVAQLHARKFGLNDILFLDDQNFVNECTTSNIFFVKNDKLITPTTEKILNGITRQTIIDIALKNGIEVIEKNINSHEIFDMDSAFVTGTAASVKQINSIYDLGHNDFSKIDNLENLKKIIFNKTEMSEFLKSKYFELAITGKSIT